MARILNVRQSLTLNSCKGDPLTPLKKYPKLALKNLRFL